MLEHLGRFVVPAAFDVLPPAMMSPPATAMLLAIALQESKCVTRRQGGNGPARGFWQFETGGVAGVLLHAKSGPQARAALVALCYSPHLTAADVRTVIEHNDVLACVFARLLLWTLPDTLPGREAPQAGWLQYLRGWRPGKPHPETWAGNFDRAWNMAARNLWGEA